MNTYFVSNQVLAVKILSRCGGRFFWTKGSSISDTEKKYKVTVLRDGIKFIGNIWQWSPCFSTNSKFLFDSEEEFLSLINKWIDTYLKKNLVIISITMYLWERTLNSLCCNRIITGKNKQFKESKNKRDKKLLDETAALLNFWRWRIRNCHPQESKIFG